jgi:hypothetical protein
MGNWTIAVRGVGSHNNGLPEDADNLAAELVKTLKAKGHNVIDADFTTGASYSLMDPEKHQADQQAMAKQRAEPPAPPPTAK